MSGHHHPRNVKSLFGWREDTELFQHQICQRVCGNDKDNSCKDGSDTFQNVHIRTFVVVSLGTPHARATSVAVSRRLHHISSNLYQ